MSKKHWIFTLLFSTLISIPGGAQTPERILLNITAAPSTSMAVTWRMSTESDQAVVEYAPANPWQQFKNHLTSIQAKKERVELPDGQKFYHYSAVIQGLKPATRYVYRVGKKSVWSEWNQFSTADEGKKPFKFAWFGDPQTNIAELCSPLFRQAFQTAPDARFWLYSGDITSEADDPLFGELFSAAGFIFRMIPHAMAPGNHDQGYQMENGKYVLDKDGKRIRTKKISPLWRAHYTLPENGISEFEEVSYAFDYQDARFLVINSNDRLEEQSAWMETRLSDNPRKWTIVAFHHPLYSAGRNRDDKKTREAFQPLFDKYGVDLVLTGHDHTYARSRKISGGKVVMESERGTVYVLSVSGPKQYEVNPAYQELFARLAGNEQLFQVISVQDTILDYKAYTVSGELFDTFQLSKQ